MTTTHDDKAGELLPCPFCAWPAKLSHRIGVSYIECIDCGAEGPPEDNDENAIAAWNRRAALSPASTGQEAGYVLMPAKLTAENGAKAALSGEFAENIKLACPECDGEDSDDCEVCSGEGDVAVPVTVEWGTIKRIYEKAVEVCAAPAQQVEAEIRDRVLEEAAKAMIHRGWTDSASVIRSLKSAAGSNNGEKAARSVDANELLYEHAKAQETACWCHKCSSPERIMSTMILCPDCGNKRCPKASDHGLACTGSNEPGQPGSVYGRPVSGM